MRPGEEYEKLIHRIYKEMEPHATVTLNDKIPGKDSGISREIDVSIGVNVAGHEMLIIVQAKDHKKKADSKILGEFASVVKDVSASRGILICSSGFAKTIRDYASKIGIDLCSAHDAMSRDWKNDIKIPIIRHATIVHFEIEIEFSDPAAAQNLQAKNIPLPAFYIGLEVLFPDGYKANPFQDIIASHWEDGTLATAPKVIGGNKDKGLQLLFDGEAYSLDLLKISYGLTEKHFLKFCTPIDYRGIQNHLTDTFKPSYLVIEDKLPNINDDTWQEVPNPADIVVKTLGYEIMELNFGFWKLVKMRQI